MKELISYDDLIWGDKFKVCHTNDTNFYKIDELYDRQDIPKVRKVISHNGDYQANEKIWNKIKNKADYWYATNLIVNDERCFPIPIGLENDYVPGSVEKKRILFECMSIDREPMKLFYVNHNIGTNPNERNRPYHVLKSDDDMTVDHNGLTTKQYYDNILKHQVILSPPGNGMDCHRTWEILYLNRIPLVKNIYQKFLFENLPVIFYDNYEQINADFLRSNIEKLSNTKFNFDKLKMRWWINEITSK